MSLFDGCEDLREYSERELSMRVMNEEDLYLACTNADSNEEIREIVDARFRYTEAQFHDLLDDLLDE